MATVMVDHNYPTADALLVVDITNEPIESAYIRVFDFTEYYAHHTTTWEAETTSDGEGKWLAPIALESGRSWVVHFQKLSEYGPVVVEITT